jgi:hypothetical protein
LDVPQGTLKAEAKVFVNAMSATDPVLSGSVSGIAVSNALPVDVSIHCLPVSPIPLTEGSTSAISHLTASISDSATNRVDGPELWFSISPTSSGITLTTIVTNGSAGAWSSSDIIDASGYSFGSGDTVSDSTPTNLYVAPNQTNYLCITRENSAADVAIKLNAYSAVRAASASFNCASYALNAGSPYYGLKAVFTPSNTFNKMYRISSSNPAVVKVEEGFSYGSGLTGLVIGGTATITLTTLDGGFTATCLLTVVNPPYASWTTETLSGGASSGAAIGAPTLDHWYSSDISTYPQSKWYRVPVTAGQAYDFYFDNLDYIDEYGNHVTSGTYTGDLSLDLYNASGSTQYFTSYGDYHQPKTIVPTETSVLVCVRSFQSSGYGTFAFGVHGQ